MSTIPVVRQFPRSFTLANGDVKFEVTSQIVDQGDLPFPHAFVLQIVDADDAKDDVLARVATPADLRRASDDAFYVKVDARDIVTLGGDPFARIASVRDVTRLPRDRTEAVRRGESFYLSVAVAALYDDVATAVAAKGQFIARLSDLVNAWRSYVEDFGPEPFSDTDLPTAGTAVEDQRIAAYRAAAALRVAADATRDAAQLALDACEREDDTLAALHASTVQDVSFLTLARDVVLGLDASAARDFALRQGAYASDARSYQALLEAKQVSLASLVDQLRAAAERCELSRAALLDAQRNASQAAVAQRDALAAVLEVCPTFDPEA